VIVARNTVMVVSYQNTWKWLQAVVFIKAAAGI